MRFTALVLLITISCCSAPYPDRRRTYGTDVYRDVVLRPRPRRPRPTTPPNPGTTPENKDLSEEDDQKAADFGVRIPPDKCVTSWTDFKDFVRDKEWMGIYGIDADEELNKGLTYKYKVRWTVAQNETLIRREAGQWWTGTNECLFLDGTFRRVRLSDNLAIFGGVLGNIFVTDNRRDYFVCSSLRPIPFCIFFICFDTQNNREGRCRNSETIMVVRDKRHKVPNSDGIREQPLKLGDLPWSEIEYLFRECFGQQFCDDRDPQIFWAWKNPSCPEPSTPAFDRGVANG